MSPAPATTRPDSRATREKSTLFCPACGHESPTDGDWQVRSTEAGENLDCPVCGKTVTIRPRASADTASTCSL